MAGIMVQDGDSLDLYFRDIASSEPLSGEEEAELAVQIREGDREARNKLVAANLRFVVKVACEYQGLGLGLEDLVGAGNVGLIEAAERFDETKGFKFISYAVWWIRQLIRERLSQGSRMVRLPVNRIDLLNNIAKASRELGQAQEAEPGSETIAEALGVPVEMVQDTLMRAQGVRSLDASFWGNEAYTLLDVLPDQSREAPDAGLIRDSDREQVEMVLATLEDREADVLRLHFGLGDVEPLTLEGIGRRLDLTRETVRQIKERALCRLRHPRRRVQLEPLRELI